MKMAIRTEIIMTLVNISSACRITGANDNIVASKGIDSFCPLIVYVFDELHR